MLDLEHLKVGEILQKVRQRKKLTLAPVAMKLQLMGCDVSIFTIIRLESDRSRLRVKELLGLSEIYGVDLAQLIREKASV